jgi:cytoskeleton protein RodZ
VAEDYVGSEVADLISSVLQVSADAAPNEPQVTVPAERAGIAVVAERPAWIRVYYPDGTVIFERILESGELYEVPETEQPAMVWAGNSGSVYVKVGEELHGPIGVGTRAARDVPLDPAAISQRFNVVADVPSTIADALSTSGSVLVQ